MTDSSERNISGLAVITNELVASCASMLTSVLLLRLRVFVFPLVSAFIDLLTPCKTLTKSSALAYSR
ncbi:hypothetical protein D3C81_2032420 [compost metagenome]